MKQLTLDYSKWRCGGNGNNNVLGKGVTYLLNKEKYMCCLGQFSLQLNEELKAKDILDTCTPSLLNIKIPLLTKIRSTSGDFIDTSFSNRAMDINDDERTTPIQKISKLRSLLKKYKYKLKVINKK